MIYVVHRYTVQQDQVLVGATTTYIQSGRSFHSGLYARHQLDGFHYICFSQYAGSVFYLCHRYLAGTHLSGHDPRFGLVRHDDHFLQHVAVFHPDVQQGVTGQGQYVLLAGVTQIGEAQLSFSFRQRNAVETVRIGGGSLMMTTLKNIGTNQRFGRRPVGYVSTDSKPAAYGFGRYFL